MRFCPFNQRRGRAVSYLHLLKKNTFNFVPVQCFWNESCYLSEFHILQLDINLGTCLVVLKVEFDRYPVNIDLDSSMLNEEQDGVVMDRENWQPSL